MPHRRLAAAARGVVVRPARTPVIAALLALMLIPLVVHRVVTAAPLTIYGDAPADGWTNCSWDSGVDFAATSQVYSGTRAIGLNVVAPRGGLCLRAGQVIDGGSYAALRFAAISTRSGQRFQVFLYDGSMQPLGYVALANAGGDPAPGAWKVYTIPLADLGAAGRQIGGVGLQEIDAGTGMLYLDEIALVEPAPAPSPMPTATPTPLALPSPSLLMYDDAPADGWTSCSWDTRVDFSATAPVYSGSRAITATPTAPRGGVCFWAGQAIDTTPYTSLHFAARTAQDGQHYQVFLYDADGQPIMFLALASFAGDPGSSAWHVYDIPLGMLGGAGRQIKGLAIQEIDAGTGQQLYLDEIALVGTSTSPTPAPTPTAPLALGAYIFGAPQNAAQIDAFKNLVGATPAIVMWYEGWGSSAPSAFDPMSMNAVASRGAIPMVTWMPWDQTGGVDQPAFALRTIVAGSHDGYIRQWARDAAAWGKPMYLRFAHEMNGTWYPWSPGVNGNTSADYVAAWRHVHDIFQQEGATNVRWVWSPNIVGSGAGPFTDMYPGDAYVDWVALDGYNWGPTQPYSVWRSVADLFGYSYDVLTSITKKPVMIAETASTEVGGNKADWITQGLLTDVPARLPRVRAVIWFNENKEQDWRVDSSAASLSAFQQAARSATYQGGPVALSLSGPSELPRPLGRPSRTR